MIFLLPSLFSEIIVAFNRAESQHSLHLDGILAIGRLLSLSRRILILLVEFITHDQLILDVTLLVGREDVRLGGDLGDVPGKEEFSKFVFKVCRGSRERPEAEVRSVNKILRKRIGQKIGRDQTVMESIK